MALVRVSCASCGKVDLAIERVAYWPDVHEMRFECPVCGTPYELVVDEGTARLLEQVGVEVHRSAAVVSWDDILEFHERFDEEMRGLIG